MTSEVDSQLRDFQPKADTLNDLIDQVAELELKRKEIEARLERARLTATSVEAITTQLKSLAEQVNELNELVPAGAPGTSGERDASQKRASTINQVIQEAQSAQEQVVEARTRTTVFFQFAVAPRDQAQAVARALEREGYIVPGEDREQGAEGKHEVRYFHPEDEGAAERLAGDVTRVLKMLDYPPVPQIGVQSLVKYRGKKPSPGVLELWLELPRL
jgi:flagellar biosynthesis chaperone FliJ